MSKRCIFQTDQPKIKEARCIIPLELKPDELMNYCTIGHSSWFCKYRLKEKECPIVKIYTKVIKILLIKLGNLNIGELGDGMLIGQLIEEYEKTFKIDLRK